MSTDTTTNRYKTRSRRAARLYVGVTVGAFVLITAVMLLMPRSVYSTLEKRDLAKPPQMTAEAVASGEYAAAVSHWFNDTEPYRDRLMELSMLLRSGMRLILDKEEAVTIQDTQPMVDTNEKTDSTTNDTEDVGVSRVNHSGIIIVGSGDNVRALMAYGGIGGGESLVRVIKRYTEEMPSIRYYEMIAPIASEFYLPEKAKTASKSQLATINNIRDHLAGTPVKHVDAYSALKAHTDENIYLRTDHHWAPLGAYYAAEQLAKAAGVPFRSLEGNYQTKVVHRFVGSMYGYSRNIAVKNAPEDFVYYVPTGVDYSTTFRQYRLDSDFKVTGESGPVKGSYFKNVKDGSGTAYSLFMGGDALLTIVKTGTTNGRRLLIIKDSFGNAVPGYLFYSFEEIHVVDFRYFTHNIKNYCAQNQITDLAIVLNVFNAYASSVASRIEKFLTQRDNTFATPTPTSTQEEKEEVKGFAEEESEEGPQEKENLQPEEQTKEKAE